ncbi:MAG: hypothetical protein KDB80_01750 [Planctomycetes bacterium]|nr:hypothetical protein [Planctomycetota bacterium]
MSSPVQVCRFRSPLVLAFVALPAAYAWFVIGWRVVLGSKLVEFSELVRAHGVAFMPILPEWPLEIVWTFFVAFGVMVPVVAWTRVASVAVGAGQIRIAPSLGRGVTIPSGDVSSWSLRGERLEIRVANRRPVRLGGGRVDDVAAALESMRRRDVRIAD